MLGSHVAEALVDAGFSVTGVIRPRSNKRNIASVALNITIVHADLMDAWRVLRVVKEVQPEFVFHFAAQAFNGMSYDEPSVTLETNIGSTLNILEAVRSLDDASAVRVFVAGSSTVYGSSTDTFDGPIPEHAPLNPVSPYGVSKVATEALALQYGRTHRMHVVVGRFFIHLAPRGVEALALHEFARQVAMIERGLQQPVVQHGDVSTHRDITDVTDSAPVVVCLAATAPNLTVVNIGSNTSYSMKDLLERVVRRTTARGGIRLSQDPSRARPYDERTVRADISKLRRLTGWIPMPDIDKLIADLVQYWRHEVSFRFPGSPPGDGDGACASGGSAAGNAWTVPQTPPAR